MKRTDYCGRIDRRYLGPDRHRDGLGASAARPRRRDLHRPARPRGHRADRLRSRPRRRRSPPPRSCATSIVHRRHRPRAPASRRHGQPEPRVRRDRGARATTIEILNASLTPPFQLDDENLSETVRLEHRVLDLRRPQMQKQPDAALSRGDGGAQVPRRARLHRHRDAGALQVDARRRARVPRAVAHAPRAVLRAAAIAAALQADADDRGLRSLLPDRQVLPRRGPARRPPARIHADRHRDVVPRRARDPRR